MPLDFAGSLDLMSRRQIEDWIGRAIDHLDAMDAPFEDCEPEVDANSGDDEPDTRDLPVDNGAPFTLDQERRDAGVFGMEKGSSAYWRGA